MVIGFTLFVSVGITSSIIALFIIGLVGLSMVVYIFSKMFPKSDKLPLFETRGLLRNKPILGGLVVLVLFTIFLNLASFIEIIFLPFLLTLPYVGILFVDFLLIEGFLILLFLLVVPKGLKLPCRDEKFSDYFRTIGITKVKPLGRNLLAGFVSFAIYGTVVWIGANLLGYYYWNPEFLFRDPNPLIPGVASFGWFIWIFMIRPGLWEEVAFRGVIIPLLSRKYKQIISILISGVIFGLIHAPNIIFILLSGLDPLLAVFQVIYATLIGFSMGYMFIKTKSLLPSIIYHYLIDTVGLILMSCYIENIFIIGIYSIVFVGVIPTILNILFIKLLFRKEKKKDLLINK
jgi:membrane protease YdiL (CAAX protease family)